MDQINGLNVPNIYKEEMESRVEKGGWIIYVRILKKGIGNKKKTNKFLVYIFFFLLFSLKLKLNKKRDFKNMEVVGVKSLN